MKFKVTVEVDIIAENSKRNPAKALETARKLVEENIFRKDVTGFDGEGSYSLRTTANQRIKEITEIK